MPGSMINRCGPAIGDVNPPPWSASGNRLPISVRRKERLMRIWMTRTELAAAGAVIVLSATAGCATTYHSENARTAALPGTPACFLRRNYIGDWTVLNNSSLIMYTFPRGSGAYLVRLVQPVVGLNFNLRLGLDNVQRTGQICGNRNTFLLVPGNTPARVLITDVRKLSDPERDQLLTQAGHPAAHREASSSDAQSH